MRLVLALVLFVAAHCCAERCRGAEADEATLQTSFPRDVRPLIAKYCEDCHSDTTAEADLNLAGFAAFADVRRHPQSWQKVGQMLDTRQMPPKDATQPTDAERALLEQWVHGYL